MRLRTEAGQLDLCHFTLFIDKQVSFVLRRLSPSVYLEIKAQCSDIRFTTTIYDIPAYKSYACTIYTIITASNLCDAMIRSSPDMSVFPAPHFRLRSHRNRPHKSAENIHVILNTPPSTFEATPSWKLIHELLQNDRRRLRAQYLFHWAFCFHKGG